MSDDGKALDDNAVPPPRTPRTRVPRETIPAGERAIEAAILSHVMAAGPEGSVTPVEIAMTLGAAWHTKLTAVRRAAVHLAVEGQIEILRKGKPVDPVGVKGVIRLRCLKPTPESINTRELP